MGQALWEWVGRDGIGGEECVGDGNEWGLWGDGNDGGDGG